MKVLLMLSSQSSRAHQGRIQSSWCQRSAYQSCFYGETKIRSRPLMAPLENTSHHYQHNCPPWAYLCWRESGIALTMTGPIWSTRSCYLGWLVSLFHKIFTIPNCIAQSNICCCYIDQEQNQICVLHFIKSLIESWFHYVYTREK